MKWKPLRTKAYAVSKNSTMNSPSHTRTSNDGATIPTWALKAERSASGVRNFVQEASTSLPIWSTVSLAHEDWMRGRAKDVCRDTFAIAPRGKHGCTTHPVWPTAFSVDMFGPRAGEKHGGVKHPVPLEVVIFTVEATCSGARDESRTRTALPACA